MKKIIEKAKMLLPDLNSIINIIIWLVASYFAFRFSENLCQTPIKDINFFKENYRNMYDLNLYIFAFLTSLGLIFKKSRTWLSLILITLVGFHVGNSVILSVRGTPLIWADLFLVKEGLGMMSTYGLDKYIVPGIVLIISILICLFVLFKTEKSKSKIKFINPIGIIVAIMMLSLCSHQYHKAKSAGSINIMNWDMNDSYRIHGFLYSFFDTKLGFKVDKPEDYNSSIINTIISGFKEVDTENELKPNVLMIQLESFMDPYDIKEAILKEDPIPTFRSINEKYTSGYVQVPTFGGGTVRSEFETLTGLATDYLPVGAIPNNDILKTEPIESIAQILKTDNYTTTFIHNYTGSFYNRDIIAKNYGYDNFISKEYMDLDSDTYIYSPVDTLSIDPIKELLKSDEPQFIYNVTMEGHGSYYNGNTSNRYVSQEGLTETERNELETYCEKLAGTDKYIKELIELVNSTNEPTVIVFFSDHLPSMQVINRKDSYISGADRYKTNVVVWDNFTTEEKDSIDLELYQLTSYITEKYNLKRGLLTSFHNTYMNDENYKTYMQNLQYDIIYGKKYYNNGKNPYEKTNTTYGLKEIIVTNCYELGENVIIEGENFNRLSKVVLNDKIIPTTFGDKNTLYVLKSNMGKGTLNVSQVGIVGADSKIMTSSNSIEYK